VVRVVVFVGAEKTASDARSRREAIDPAKRLKVTLERLANNSASRIYASAADINAFRCACMVARSAACAHSAALVR
jgi:hypothetical protein